MKLKADLHVHSCYSDGSQSFQEILGKAAGLGLTHISFCDHDCTLHTVEALKWSTGFDIKVIPGVEISAFDRVTGRKVHILGYDYSKNKAIEELCAPILKRRHANCLKQIEILGGLGYRILPEQVLPYAAGGTIYKQHILKYLHDSGQSSLLFGDVYAAVFKNGGPCDFDIQYVDAADAVRAIREDGGRAVLAHPGQQENFDLVAGLREAGLSGIEIHHPANTPRHRDEILELAKRYGLFCTGGSDFHGLYEAVPRLMATCLAPEDCELLIKD